MPSDVTIGRFSSTFELFEAIFGLLRFCMDKAIGVFGEGRIMMPKSKLNFVFRGRSSINH